MQRFHSTEARFEGLEIALERVNELEVR